MSTELCGPCRLATDTAARVSVPQHLLLEVLETAEADSSAVESEHAGNAGDRAAYEAEREKISELRRHATPCKCTYAADKEVTDAT